MRSDETLETADPLTVPLWSDSLSSGTSEVEEALVKRERILHVKR